MITEPIKNLLDKLKGFSLGLTGYHVVFNVQVYGLICKDQETFKEVPFLPST
jgi:hypothetical protein